MRLRIPLVMKKRGERRTGLRWLGPLGEAVVYAAFFLVGALGVALIVAGEVQPPWPWLVAVIPASLVVYGALGLVELLWQSSISTEMRSAMAQRAADLEQRLTSDPSRPQLPSVPAIDQVVDSPGVRLAHRLPIDASPNWLLLGMTIICICWNILVGMFVYHVVELHSEGRPNWLLTWLMVPFVLAGLWTLVALVKELWMNAGLGDTRLEISRHPLRPGEACRVFVSQAGRVNMRWLKLELVCEEWVTFAQGTDTRTETERVFRRLMHRRRKFDIAPDKPLEEELELLIPSGAMHSFVSPHNAVEWSLLVRGKASRWPLFERRFPVYVYPPQARPVEAPQTEPAAVEGAPA